MERVLPVHERKRKTPWIGARLFLAILCPALTCPGVQAQEKGEVDTAYVSDYSHLLTARVFGSTKFNTLRLFGNGGLEDLLYRPNNQINIGLGMSYRRFTLNLGFRAPGVNDDDGIYGNTRFIDAQANMLSPERATNLFLQYFRGYHISSHSRHAFGWGEQGTDVPYRADVREFNIGISTMRVYNSRRFSYRAAFNQDAWQRKSQGTWMLGGYATYYSVRADSSLIPTTVTNDFASEASIRIGDYIDLGPMAGHAYTFVYNDHWFISGSLAVGAGLSVQHVITDHHAGGDGITLGPGWHVQGRGSLGYNSRRQQVSLSYNQERVQYFLPRQNVLAWSVGNVRFNIVHRFSQKVALIDRVSKWLKRKTPEKTEDAVPATD